MKLRKIAIAFLCALSLSLSAISIWCIVVANAQAEETGDTAISYTASDLQEGGVYTIQSNGAPFYFSFGRYKNSDGSYNKLNDLGHITWTLVDYNIENVDTDNGVAGAYSTSADEVAKGYGRDVNPASDDTKASLEKTNVLMQLFAFKSQTGGTTNYILRGGVWEYTQTSAGDFSDEETSKYGFYFTGITMEMTIMVHSVYASELQLYYADGVTVTSHTTLTEEQTPKVEITNATLYSNTGIGANVRGAIYTEKVCFIPYQAATPKDEAIIYKLTQLVISRGEETIPLTAFTDGSVSYLIFNAKVGDIVKILYEEFAVDFDEATIYDLIDISGQKEIIFDEVANSRLGIGNLPNTANTAFRFKFNTPNVSAWSGLYISKFGMWINNENLWSNFGYIITFYQNTVRILTAEEVELISASSSDIKPKSTIEVVIGLKKGYIDGVYSFNRVYVTINNQQVAFYDDYLRSTLGNAIVGPYLDDALAKCSIENAYEVVELTNATGVENADVSVDKYVKKGEEATITFVEKVGSVITSVSINGEDKTSDVKRSGRVLTLALDSVDSDITIAYTTEKKVYALTIGDAVGVSADYESFVAAHDRAEIAFTLRTGYILSKLTINGEDAINQLTLRNGKFILTLIIDADTAIEVSSAEKSYAVTAANVEHATIDIVETNVKAGKSAQFTIAVEEGYKIASVLVNGEKIEQTDGFYTIAYVYADQVITIETVTADTMEIPSGISTKSKGCGGSLSGGMAVCAVTLIVCVFIFKKRGLNK